MRAKRKSSRPLRLSSPSHCDALNRLLLPAAEERAKIYSSDSDEGSDDDKAQRLMKAKKLDSDEVGVVISCTDRGRCHAVHCKGVKVVRGGFGDFMYTGQRIHACARSQENANLAMHEPCTTCPEKNPSKLYFAVFMPYQCI